MEHPCFFSSFFLLLRCRASAWRAVLGIAKRGAAGAGLGARGLDLPDVAMVVEYQLAPNVVEHVHRVGRTARAGKAGKAISLVHAASENEASIVNEVERCRRGGWKYL